MVAAFTFFLGKDEANKEEEGEADDDSDQEVQVLFKNIIFLHFPGRGRFRGARGEGRGLYNTLTY